MGHHSCGKCLLFMRLSLHQSASTGRGFTIPAVTAGMRRGEGCRPGKRKRPFIKHQASNLGLSRGAETPDHLSQLYQAIAFCWLAEWLAHVVLAISPDRHLASSGLPHVLAPSIHTLTPFRIQAAGESGRRQACGPLHLAAHRVRGCKTSPESRSGEPREVFRSILFPCLLLSSTRLAAGC